MEDTPDLLEAITKFCAEQGMAETTFGLRSVNDGKLVARLRAGKTITMATYRQVRDFMQLARKAEAA